MDYENNTFFDEDVLEYARELYQPHRIDHNKNNHYQQPQKPHEDPSSSRNSILDNKSDHQQQREPHDDPSSSRNSILNNDNNTDEDVLEYAHEEYQPHLISHYKIDHQQQQKPREDPSSSRNSILNNDNNTDEDVLEYAREYQPYCIDRNKNYKNNHQQQQKPHKDLSSSRNNIRGIKNGPLQQQKPPKDPSSSRNNIRGIKNEPLQQQKPPKDPSSSRNSIPNNDHQQQQKPPNDFLSNSIREQYGWHYKHNHQLLVCHSNLIEETTKSQKFNEELDDDANYAQDGDIILSRRIGEVLGRYNNNNQLHVCHSNLIEETMKSLKINEEHDVDDDVHHDDITELLKLGDDPRNNGAIALHVRNIISELEIAAEEDVYLNRRFDKQPEIYKLKKLLLLTRVLSTKQFQSKFLDGGVLNLLSKWLQPLPDGRLPDVKVRAGILNILTEFPIDLANYGTRKELSMSGLGTVLMSLIESNEETDSNRELATDLVFEWASVGIRNSYSVE
uniref:protein IWS1 homolog n=1 Tax=Erigeron canadensis TaxID=72917 RepID=UPI001CB8AE3B|nr:protein IWS1 homolog [Erigeron canadensis]